MNMKKFGGKTDTLNDTNRSFSSRPTLQVVQKKVKTACTGASQFAPIADNLPLFDSQISVDHKPEWLTTEEAASYLRISVGSLRNKTSYGAVPRYKLGRSNRYRVSDLRSLLLKSKENLNGN